MFIFLDQTNSAVDPRTLMFKKNMYGKPEVRQLFGIILDTYLWLKAKFSFILVLPFYR